MPDRLRSSIARAIVAALALGAVVVLGPGATAAVAVPHAVSYSCTTHKYDIEYAYPAQSFTLTATAPASVANGSTVRVGWSFDRMPESPPFDVTGATLTTTADLKVSRPGYAAGTLTDQSTTSSPPVTVPARTELPGPLTFTVSYRAVVDQPDDAVTFSPGDLRIDFVTAGDDFDGAYTLCTPDAGAPTLASIAVTGVAPACVATDTCAGERTFVGDTTPDTLTFESRPSQSDPDEAEITIPSYPTSATEQTVEVPNVFFGRVTDTRTTPVGWSLTAEVTTPLTDVTGAVIPAGSVSVAGMSCTPPAGASGGAPAEPGNNAALDVPTPLCSVRVGDLGPTGAAGGQWDVVGDLQVRIPPYQATGYYVGTLTLVLS